MCPLIYENIPRIKFEFLFSGFDVIVVFKPSVIEFTPHIITLLCPFTVMVTPFHCEVAPEYLQSASQFHSDGLLHLQVLLLCVSDTQYIPPETCSRLP